MKRILLTLTLLLGASPLWAATYYVDCAAGAGGTQLDYNIAVPVTTTVMIQIVGGTKTLADLQGVGLMTNGLTSDPLFISPQTNDFRLQPTSPAINAGVDVGLNSDFLGKMIVGPVDIGAYENQHNFGVFEDPRSWTISVGTITSPAGGQIRYLP